MNITRASAVKDIFAPEARMISPPQEGQLCIFPPSVKRGFPEALFLTLNPVLRADKDANLVPYVIKINRRV
jgi:hypothetical protein